MRRLVSRVALTKPIILIALSVGLLVIGGVAVAIFSGNSAGETQGPATTSTRSQAHLSGVSGVSGEKGSGPTGVKNGGLSGASGVGPNGGGATGPTQVTSPSDKEADITKIRVAITAGTCLWDLDTFDLTASGSVRNNNSVDAFADIEVIWLDSEGTELDVSSTLEVLSPGETLSWDVAGASIDAPVGALRCTVSLLE